MSWQNGKFLCFVIAYGSDFFIVNKDLIISDTGLKFLFSFKLDCCHVYLLSSKMNYLPEVSSACLRLCFCNIMIEININIKGCHGIEGCFIQFFQSYAIIRDRVNNVNPAKTWASVFNCFEFNFFMFFLKFNGFYI